MVLAMNGINGNTSAADTAQDNLADMMIAETTGMTTMATDMDTTTALTLTMTNADDLLAMIGSDDYAVFNDSAVDVTAGATKVTDLAADAAATATDSAAVVEPSPPLLPTPTTPATTDLAAAAVVATAVGGLGGAGGVGAASAEYLYLGEEEEDEDEGNDDGEDDSSLMDVALTMTTIATAVPTTDDLAAAACSYDSGTVVATADAVDGSAAVVSPPEIITATATAASNSGAAAVEVTTTTTGESENTCGETGAAEALITLYGNEGGESPKRYTEMTVLGNVAKRVPSIPRKDMSRLLSMRKEEMKNANVENAEGDADDEDADADVDFNVGADGNSHVIAEAIRRSNAELATVENSNANAAVSTAAEKPKRFYQPPRNVLRAKRNSNNNKSAAPRRDSNNDDDDESESDDEDNGKKIEKLEKPLPPQLQRGGKGIRKTDEKKTLSSTRSDDSSSSSSSSSDASDDDDDDDDDSASGSGSGSSSSGDDDESETEAADDDDDDDGSTHAESSDDDETYYSLPKDRRRQPKRKARGPKSRNYAIQPEVRNHENYTMPPSTVTPPPHLKPKLKVLSRSLRLVRKNGYIMSEFPEVDCDASEFEVTESLDNKVTPQRFHYPKYYHLTSLRGLVKECLEDELAKSCTISSSLIGAALRDFSCKKEHHRSFYHPKINGKNNLSRYCLVYGAIPTHYKNAACYLIREFDRIVKGKKNSATVAKAAAQNNTALLFEGEMELLLHQYWQLESVDLINWRDDLIRKPHKRLLSYLWNQMNMLVTPITRRIRAGTADEMERKYGKELQDIVNKIRAFAKFDDANVVTKESLLYIKYYFDMMLYSCRLFMPTPKDRDTFCALWDIFMKNCNIHHYMCVHTQTIMMTRARNMAEILKSMINNTEASERTCATRVLSMNTINQLFANVLKRKRSVNKHAMRLRDAANNLFYTVCRSIGHHMVRYGIINKVQYVITEEHLAGYISAEGRCRYTMHAADMPFFEKRYINSAIQLILDTIKAQMINTNAPKLDYKFTCDTLLSAYLRYVFYCSVAGVLDRYQKARLSNSGWSKLLAASMDDYIRDNYNTVATVDDWSNTDEADMDRRYSADNVVHYPTLERERSLNDGRPYPCSDDDESDEEWNNEADPICDNLDEYDYDTVISKDECDALLATLPDVMLPSYDSSSSNSSSSNSLSSSNSSSSSKAAPRAKTIVAPKTKSNNSNSAPRKRPATTAVTVAVVASKPVAMVASKQQSMAARAMLSAAAAATADDSDAPVAKKSKTDGGDVESQQQQQQSRQQQRRRRPVKSAVGNLELEMRRYKEAHQNTSIHPYVGNCGRIKCCLCFSRTTNRVIKLSQTVHVAACVACFYRLNREPLHPNQMLKLLERVADKVKAPIAFVPETASLERVFNDNLETRFKTRLTYNRFKPERQNGGDGDGDTTAAAVVEKSSPKSNGNNKRKASGSGNGNGKGTPTKMRIVSKEFISDTEDTATEDDDDDEDQRRETADAITSIMMTPNAVAVAAAATPQQQQSMPMLLSQQPVVVSQ